MKRVALSCLLASLGGMAVWAIAASPDASNAKTASSGGAKIVAPAEDLIVHEWGTFTTFSGSDGVHLDFRPLAAAHSDLPDFVWDRASGSPQAVFSKARLRGKVRMETPVTYFYTDRERTIRASVEFPQGMLTEFYPPVESFSPPFDIKAATTDGEKIGNSRLDWGKIKLIPAKAFLPTVADETDAAWLQQRVLENLCLPGNGHYAAARATDSAFVLTNLKSKGPFSPGGRYLEKFLFYRGVGKFELPVQVEAGTDGEIRVHNRGAETLKSLFLVESTGNEQRMSAIPQVAAGQAAVMPRPVPVTDRQAARDQMVTALVQEGLYEKEARAMVATWDDSWFLEEGTRVFYMVPRPVTDSLLPLKIEPQPKETVRVLVGRLEVMRASEEKRLVEMVRRSAAARNVERQKQQETGVTPPELPVPEEIAKLGRLAEPALVRVELVSRDREVRDEAEYLLYLLRRMPKDL